MWYLVNHPFCFIFAVSAFMRSALINEYLSMDMCGRNQSSSGSLLASTWSDRLSFPFWTMKKIMSWHFLTDMDGKNCLLFLSNHNAFYVVHSSNLFYLWHIINTVDRIFTETTHLSTNICSLTLYPERFLIGSNWLRAGSRLVPD